jgi:RNA polymerase sigma factor (sigma-70 family)
LATIREPNALPGWLATTARRECLLLLRNQNRQIKFDDQHISGQPEPEPDTGLLTEERRIALRDAFTRLPDRDRQLLSMLFADPPMPYTEISTRIGMPIGAIGPTRQRCLARLRRHPAVAALLVQQGNTHTVYTPPTRESANTRSRSQLPPNPVHPRS